MNALRPLVEATVLPEEIDHLGHMNVHFYAARATEATHALVASLGLDAHTCAAQGLLLLVSESFTRHYREQRVGAHLQVRGGVLSAETGSLRLVHELVNRETHELSAAFVHRVALWDRKRREREPFPQPLLRRVEASRVAWPETARPRSLDLDRLPRLPLEEARARGLAMRAPRRITADECDAQGDFVATRILELFWRGDPARPGAGVPLFDAGDGRRFGWATLESRSVLLELPRLGARVQSFSAEVDRARKTSFRHLWVFDLDSERLLAFASIVNLAFDVEARRAIEIPASVRAQLEADHHPDLL